MAAPQQFTSADLNSPGTGITGSAGCLITILDACLVNGFTTFNVTSINRSGTTATVVCAASHGMVTGQIVRVAGAGQAAYNIDAAITKIDATTFTYQVAGSPATPATGTVTARVAPAGGGWTKTYSGTNLAVYRAPAGNQFYLRVDATNAAYSLVRLYETMSDINTGTGPTPSASQNSGNLYWMSGSASGKPWRVIADSKGFYFYSDYFADNTNCTCGYFGDFISYKSGDAFNSCIVGGMSTTASGNYFAYITANITTANSGHYAVRSFTQSGGSVDMSLLGMNIDGAAGYISSTGISLYPEPVNGGIIMERKVIAENATKGIRGYLPGAWLTHPAKPGSNYDTLSGSGTLAGKSFIQLNMYSSSSALIELSDWWA